MAVLIPFRSKPEPPLKSGSVRVIEGLTCPACEYEACSSADLHTHVQHKHSPTRRGEVIKFVERPSIVEDLQ